MLLLHPLQAGSPRPLYLRLQEEFERKQLAEAEEYRKKVEAISKAAHVSGAGGKGAGLCRLGGLSGQAGPARAGAAYTSQHYQWCQKPVSS
jgi:hypothetical protein